MTDSDCVRFLQRALPRLRMRWPGFRRVRKQVCKRVGRRLRELGLSELAAYEAFLETHPEEWTRLDALCRITISRFYRDRRTFDFLQGGVFPELAQLARQRGDGEVRCWSAGCASGEEAYTLAMIWHFSVRRRFPNIPLRVVATDADERLLERARDGSYAASSLKDLPAAWQAQAFDRHAGRLTVRPLFREPIDFRREDLRSSLPDGPFHLILCRNLAFTYFEESLQRQLFLRIVGRLLPGAALVIGIHEALPTGEAGVSPWAPKLGVYRREGAAG